MNERQARAGMARTLAFISRAVLTLSLVVVAVLPGAVQSSEAAQPPPPTTEPAPIMMVPGTVAVDEQVESAVRQALAQARDAVPTANYHTISDIQAVDNWLFVSIVGLEGLDADLNWNLLDNASWFGLILLRQDENNHWTGAVEGTLRFSLLLNDMPETILSDTSKQNMDPIQRPLALTSTYRFPWQSGTSMRYGSLGVHNAGFSGVVPGWKAVDFLSDGNTGAGHAPNRLLAAASGSISYICRDNTSVAIRIGDLLYVHLLDNSNLTYGHSFNQGDEMGQLRPGSFDDTCGYASQGANLFHVHWGFPNTGSFEAGGWTLNLSDQLWRRGDDTRGIGSWFQAGEGGSSSPCPAPSLRDPGNGHVESDDRTITFRWDNLSCDHNGFTFRVKTVPDMESGGETVVDTGEGNTERTQPFDLRWDNRDLYWSVRAANAPGGADWATVRRFRIEPKPPNDPPSISFNTANGNSFSSGRIESRDRNWTFQGMASDPEGQLNRIEFRCDSCDNRGSGTSQTTGNNWSLTRNNMAGRNDVYFVAYDDQGQSTTSRHLDLNIDLVAPSTGHNLVGTMGESGWHVSPVDVRLHADDGSTGRARVGVREIHYRLNGGAWQIHSGDTKPFTVSTDGTHTLRYYARDRVGNQEGQGQVTFKIDATLPGAPGAATETHGAVSGQWQTAWNDPAFTWVMASDATSGLWYYRVTWNETLKVTTGASYDPPAVPTGSYDLSVQAVDRAGNVGPAGASFTFRYDGTPPHAPEIVNNDGVASGLWQTRTRTADFSWATPYDEGSGVAGYYVYWGPNENGASGTLTTNNSFVDDTPICAPDEAATHYLRVRSEDGVGLQSEWVGFALSYDGVPPTATLTANYGNPIAHQVNVHLDIAAGDVGSGVHKMSLSNDGRTWSDWMDYEPEIYWEIPDVGRRAYPIYLQVQDRATNVSQVVSDTVYFDVNRPHPSSESFELWDEMMTAGGGVISSTNFSARVSLGQPLDSPILTSAEHILYSGFQAGALATPTQTVTYTSFIQQGHVIASGGTGAGGVTSTNHILYGTLGQPADVRVITSASYIITSGFWAGGGIAAELPSPPLEPPPPSLPSPQCEFYSISLNDGAYATSSPLVTATLCGPDAVEVQLSNDESFAGATWQTYTTTVPWTLETYGDHVVQRTVYARFRDGYGQVHGDFSDDIIYDPNAPSGAVGFDPSDFLPGLRLQAAAILPLAVSDDSVELFLSASDDSSGLAEMQVSESADFEGAEWHTYTAIAPTALSEGDGLKTVYVRFRDHAGNISTAAAGSLLVDTSPPTGTVQVVEGILGPDAVMATLTLSAFDNASGVSEMRISQSPAFTDTVWVSYTQQAVVPVHPDEYPVFFVQFRDWTGNESAIYAASYQADAEPPWGRVEVIGKSGDQYTLQINVWDNLSPVTELRISPDFWFLEDVTVMPFQSRLVWDFGERDVIYVIFVDAAGNYSGPYRVLAAFTNTVYLPLVLRQY